MTHASRSDPLLRNQSLVTFQFAGTEQVAYSNTVSTPLVGPKLSLCKSAGTECAALGQTIGYRLELENTGNKSAEVTLYDILPEGVSFIANSLLRDGVPLPGAKPSAGVSMGRIEAGSSACIQFQAIVTALPQDLKLVNQAYGDYTFHTQDGRSISGSVRSNVLILRAEGIAAAASLKASTTQTFVGDVVRYETTVVNQGNVPFRDTVVLAPVPDGGLFVPGSVTIGDIHAPASDPVAGIILGALAPGASVRVAFRVRIEKVPAANPLISRAYVKYVAYGHPGETETNTVAVMVVQAAVAVSKSVDKRLATRGEPLRYEVTVDNESAFAIDGVLVDSFPDNALFVWDSVTLNDVPLKGVLPADGIRLGSVKAHSRAVAAFQATVPISAFDRSSPVVNESSLNFTFRLGDGRLIQETLPSNAVRTELVLPVFDVHVTVMPPVVEAGDMMEYTVKLTNRGNWPADVLLTGLTADGAFLMKDTLRVNGGDAGSRLTAEGLPLGAVAPRQSVRIDYAAATSPLWELPTIGGYVGARYRFEVEGRFHDDEVRSNGYTVAIEDPYE
ncbi:DUF11 domain-containing protein [Paenibacillus hodogayensis]|uniref:DUF11 domain-containing protein n=1 Tax=Paenibacillus hodogayensis TaxID=279208 RepID=A0ABV5W214_9BACL